MCVHNWVIQGGDSHDTYPVIFDSKLLLESDLGVPICRYRLHMVPGKNIIESDLFAQRVSQQIGERAENCVCVQGC